MKNDGAPALSYSTTPTATLGQNLVGFVGVDNRMVLDTSRDKFDTIGVANLLVGTKASVHPEMSTVAVFFGDGHWQRVFAGGVGAAEAAKPGGDLDGGFQRGERGLVFFRSVCSVGQSPGLRRR